MPASSPPASVASLPVHTFDGVTNGSAAYPSDKAGSYSWSNVAWKKIFKAQTVAFASLVVCSPAIVLLIVFQFIQPYDKAFLLYDATIAYPTNSSTIPYWCAWVLPGLAFLASLLIAELFCLKPVNQTLSNALSLILHHTVDAILGLIVTACLTDVGKVTVGELRPDFLTRCYPDGLLPNVNAATAGPVWGANVTAPLCAEEASSAVTEGKKSFPSGHSSSAAFWAAYVAVYWVHQGPLLGPRHAANGTRGALYRALSQAVALVFVLILVSWAYGVGLSRIIDNKHHPSDVVGGLLLGSAVGVLFSARAVSLRRDALVTGEIGRDSLINGNGVPSVGQS